MSSWQSTRRHRRGSFRWRDGVLWPRPSSTYGWRWLTFRIFVHTWGRCSLDVLRGSDFLGGLVRSLRLAGWVIFEVLMILWSFVDVWMTSGLSGSCSTLELLIWMLFAVRTLFGSFSKFRNRSWKSGWFSGPSSTSGWMKSRADVSTLSMRFDVRTGLSGSLSKPGHFVDVWGSLNASLSLSLSLSLWSFVDVWIICALSMCTFVLCRRWIARSTATLWSVRRVASWQRNRTNRPLDLSPSKTLVRAWKLSSKDRKFWAEYLRFWQI